MIFNILDYGADQNGNENSSSAIQKAIDDCSKRGGMVYVPAGAGSYTHLTLPTIGFV